MLVFFYSAFKNSFYPQVMCSGCTTCCFSPGILSSSAISSQDHSAGGMPTGLEAGDLGAQLPLEAAPRSTAGKSIR